MSEKDAGLRIRVEKALREEFLSACHARDRHASQVLREFMREYVARKARGDNRTAIEARPSDDLDRR